MTVSHPDAQPSQAESGKKAEPPPPPLPDAAVSPSGRNGEDGKPSSPGTEGAGAAEDSSKGTGDGESVRESRSLKGAAPDEDNSSAASMLRARLGS